MRLAEREGHGETNMQARIRKIGDILIEEGLISESQLREASKKQVGLRTYKPIGQILVEMKAITQKQLNFVLDRFKKRLRLGDILIRAGAINEEILQIALDHQRKKGLRLGEALVELNFITEEVMRQTLCLQLNVPFVDLDNITVDRTLSRLINRRYAQRHQIVPIARIGNTITLAMDDPTDTDLVEELQAITGFSVNVVTSRRAAILHAFTRLYEDSDVTKIASRLQLIEEDALETVGMSEYLESDQIRRADALVGQLIGLGLSKSASDIHIETTDRRLYTRFRIDGVLQELHLGSVEDELNRFRREVVSRVKILGNLDIAERRRPQDGSFRARILRKGEDTKIDFRVSVVAGYYGENVVIRILDPKNAPKSIDELGFSEPINKRLHQLLRRSTGIILVTGPTGSGKSTTLYGALMTSYRPGM